MPRRSTLIVALIAALGAACTEPAPREKTLRFDVGAPDIDQIERVATEHLATTGVLDDIDALSARAVRVDRRDTAHVRLDQSYGGVPVLGGQVVVHVPADGLPIAVTDHLLHELHVDVVPHLAGTEAEAIARAASGRPAASLDGIELVIVREGGVDHLTWRVALRDLEGADPSLPIVFVEAGSGAVVLQYDNLQTARDRRTFDAGGTESWPATPARTETQPPVGSVPVDTAHDYTAIAWDYYDLLQGRDSFDDAGAPVVSVVELGPDYYNAFWNGSILGYGDGGPNPGFAESLDIVAHELTHAVTSHTAELVYNQESGGLNEATSDIMAAVIESWEDGWTVTELETWRVGEGRGGSGFRSMSNPRQLGAIDSYLDYTPTLDVHVTSGIANRAFVAWVDSPDLTIEQAGDIWYTALTNYMTPRTSFAQARTATQQAAFDLFGPGPQVAAVAYGWSIVDVPGTPAYEVFDQVGPVSMTSGQSHTYTFTAAQDAHAVRFLLVGDDGDADLYVNEGSTAPTPTAHDCASESFGTREVCSFDPATPGVYTVLVESNWTFNDARLYAWQAVPGGVVCTDVDGDGFTTCEGDCNDGSTDVFPGAPETCNGVDDDCNGQIDGPDATGVATWYYDADGDGYGDPLWTALGCVAPAGYVGNADDCDDGEVKVFPGAAEVCNLADDDCDGTVDGPHAAGAVSWYADADGDGFGDPAAETVACVAPTGAVRNPDDCDDEDDAVHPEAMEACNGIDDDCDTVVDPPGSLGTLTWYRDADGDGHGTVAVVEVSCTQPAGHVRLLGDCDDGRSDVHPDAAEVCNGIDDDCDTVIDPPDSEDARDWFVDGDRDGFGDATGSPVRACAAPADHVADATDCDDVRADVSPGALEVCDAGEVDEDCDGEVNEDGAANAAAYWLDVDGDGFGDPETETTACSWPDLAIAAGGFGDCDDTREAVFPGALERCDGVDEDCDGAIDDDAFDAEVYYIDRDGDGFGSERVVACEEPEGAVLDGGDCDDDDASTFPGADEIPDDAIDQDCDGADLSAPAPAARPEPDPLGCSTSRSSGQAALVLGLIALLGRRRRSGSA